MPHFGPTGDYRRSQVSTAPAGGVGCPTMGLYEAGVEWRVAQRAEPLIADSCTGRSVRVIAQTDSSRWDMTPRLALLERAGAAGGRPRLDAPRLLPVVLLAGVKRSL